MKKRFGYRDETEATGGATSSRNREFDDDSCVTPKDAPKKSAQTKAQPDDPKTKELVRSVLDLFPEQDEKYIKVSFFLFTF